MPSTSAAREQRAREGPKKVTGGNTIPDRAWIEEIRAIGELHEPDEAFRPAGFLYNVIWQWEGTLEDLNIEFFESFIPAGRRRCNGTAYVRDERGGYVIDADWNRLTRPCLAAAARGTVICHSHGAKIPQVRAAAEKVLADAAEIVAMRLVGLTGATDENAESIAHKDRISAANSVLDRAGIKGGVNVEVSTPGFKNVLERMFGDDKAEPDGD